MKILLVDDDEISLRILSEYLRAENFKYEMAGDGKKAWEMLTQQPQEFKLVITDRVMPHLHGLDLLLRMKADSLLKNIPVVILTGEAEKKEIVKAIKAGAFDFLYKPIDKDLLLSIVRRVFFSGIIPT